MNYDDPEPTEEELAEAAAERLAKDTPIRIEGLTFAAVEHVIRGIIEGNWRLTERVETAIDEAVTRAVSRLVDDTIRERIVVAVDAAIASGFPTFDTYSGRETGRTSLPEMVHKALSKKDNSYRNEGTVAERAVAKAVAELFDKDLKGTLEQLRADLKRQADGVFQAKIVAGMKEALGLRN